MELRWLVREKQITWDDDQGGLCHDVIPDEPILQVSVGNFQGKPVWHDVPTVTVREGKPR
jgi:hypothetical protein